MNTIVLQPQLAERLSQVAEQDTTTLEELVNTAVREYVDVMARRKIHAESKAFQARHAELLQRYLGEYVAVHKGNVVDHDKDLSALHQRVRRRYGRHTPVLLRQVTEQAEMEFAFRSPRLEWSV
jgi:predicted transcriptional regulator